MKMDDGHSDKENQKKNFNRALFTNVQNTYYINVSATASYPRRIPVVQLILPTKKKKTHTHTHKQQQKQ